MTVVRKRSRRAIMINAPIVIMDVGQDKRSKAAGYVSLLGALGQTG